jgi:hypothetical protein
MTSSLHCRDSPTLGWQLRSRAGAARPHSACPTTMTVSTPQTPYSVTAWMAGGSQRRPGWGRWSTPPDLPPAPPPRCSGTWQGHLDVFVWARRARVPVGCVADALMTWEALLCAHHAGRAHGEAEQHKDSATILQNLGKMNTNIARASSISTICC